MSPVRRSARRRFGLTPRELQVVGTIVAGYSNREIAKKFSLSEDTVKHHLSKIFDKTGASNRLELALFAVHHRILDTDRQRSFLKRQWHFSAIGATHYQVGNFYRSCHIHGQVRSLDWISGGANMWKAIARCFFLMVLLAAAGVGAGAAALNFAVDPTVDAPTAI